MGGAISRRNDRNNSYAPARSTGSMVSDPTISGREPGSITPLGRSPTGELIYQEGQNPDVMMPNYASESAPSGFGHEWSSMGSGPLSQLERRARARQQNRLLTLGLGALLFILVILVLMVFLLLNRDNSTTIIQEPINNNNNNNNNADTTSTKPTVAARTTATPTVSPLPLSPPPPLPTLSPTTELPTLLPSASRVSIPSCPVCLQDGPITFPDPSALLFPFGSHNDNEEYADLTCQGLSSQIEDLVQKSQDPADTCRYWQILASIHCGCEYPHPQASCPLCPDGTLPSPEDLARTTLVEKSDNPGVYLTCLELILSAATITSVNTNGDNDDADCDRFSSYARHCQCPGYVAAAATTTTAPSPLPTTMAPSTIAPTAVIVKQTLPPSLAPNTEAPTSATCRLCADGAPVREEFLQEYGARTVDGDNITCQVLEAATENAETDCFTLQLLGIINCGCEHPHPRSACSLCPKGELPPAAFRDAQVPVFAKPNDFRTCGDLWRQAAATPETDPASCAILQERYATPCGCDVPPTQSPKPTPPPAPTRAPCLSFCGDGLPVPDEYVDRIAIASSSSGRSFTCGQIEEYLEYFSDDCFQLQLLGSYKCGCVQPHPDAGCNLCSGGGLPPDEFLDAETSLIGNDGNPATCQTLFLVVAEELANSQQCVLYQSRWGASQCGCPAVEASPP